MEQVLLRLPGNKLVPNLRDWRPGIGWAHHLTYAQVRAEYPDTQLPFSFAFVRNPWARVVSEYTWRIKKHGNWITHPFNREAYGERPGWSLKRVREEVTFAQFIMAEGFPWEEVSYAQHMAPQVDYTHVNGQQRVTFIGRMEDLQSDFNTVAQVLGLQNYRLPHANATVHKPYMDYYKDPTIRRAVEEKYALDISTYKYSFDE